MKECYTDRYTAYCIMNKYTKEEYIGITKDVSKRMLAHRARLRAKTHIHLPLYSNMLEYGENAFIYGVIEVNMTRKQALRIEKQLVEKHQPALNSNLK